MHGNSVVDGIGGSVKRFVCSRILSSSDVFVKSAKDFAEVASMMPSNQVFHLTTSNLNRKNIAVNLEQIKKSAKAISNIKKCHSFEVQSTVVRKKVTEKIVAFKITPLDR